MLHSYLKKNQPIFIIFLANLFLIRKFILYLDEYCDNQHYVHGITPINHTVVVYSESPRHSPRETTLAYSKCSCNCVPWESYRGHICDSIIHVSSVICTDKSYLSFRRTMYACDFHPMYQFDLFRFWCCLLQYPNRICAYPNSISKHNISMFKLLIRMLRKMM